MPAIELIVFDAGGVLFDVQMDDFLSLLGRAGGMTAHQVRARLDAPGSPLDQYERGQTNTDEFLSTVTRQYNLTCSPDELTQAFCGIVTPYPETSGILESVRPQAELAILSDTSPLHLDRCIRPATAPHIQTFFTSFAASFKKPDRRMFDFLANQVQVEGPGAILFVDDKEPHVEEARSMGWNAETVAGPPSLVEVLRAYGFAI